MSSDVDQLFCGCRSVIKSKKIDAASCEHIRSKDTPIQTGNIDRRKCGANSLPFFIYTFSRTLLSSLVVIQTNPIVQTQGDRLIKVGCIIDNNMHDNGMIDDISLGSSLTFSNRFLGSYLKNVTK